MVVFRVHRGSSRTKELLDAGVNVAAGSDNVNDMWFAFGRLDPVETAYVAILSAAPSMPWVPPADLVVVEAGTITDVLRGLSPRRVTVKNGKVVGGMTTERWARSGDSHHSPALR